MKSAPQMQACALTSQSLNLPLPIWKNIDEGHGCGISSHRQRGKFKGLVPESLSSRFLDQSTRSLNTSGVTCPNLEQE